MNSYSIEIHGIFTAPEHKIFGKKTEDLSGGDLISKTSANLIADCGIEGDRFCRSRPNYNGHITFFSQEAWNEISEILNLPKSIRPEITRRNIIVSGVDLKALYQTSFAIQNIQFMGATHCAPCIAMNKALGPGAREAMRGRGGLRAQIKSNGNLCTGSAELLTDTHFDPRNASKQPPLAKIP